MNDEYNPSEGEDHPSDSKTDPVEAEEVSNLSDRQLLYQDLDSLVIQICQETLNIWKRKRCLTQLVTKMKNSGLIWKKDVPYYEDAVQEQWEFFCSNLWESRTGTQYDRTRSNPITWFNNCLQWRLLTFAQKIAEENQRRCQNEKILEDGQLVNLIEILPAEDETHIIECIQCFEEVQNWIETNPEGILNAHIRGRKDLTCQVILRSLLSGKTFTQMAAEYGCAYQTIYGFWKNKCRPHVQAFRENHDY
jgi:hypothetical protein